MKVLVTGATGFIGRHVADACLEAGYDVRALVRPQTPGDALRAKSVEIAPGDITDPGSIRRAVSGVDAVLHLAALFAFWAPDASAFEKVNVGGTVNVTRACAEAGVRVVYCSTVAAVGASTRPDRPVDEDSEWNLAGIGDRYFVTKRRAEEAVREMAAAGDVDAVIVNPTAPMGPGDAKPTPSGELLVTFLNGLSWFWVEGGINVADVRDVARGHLLALEKGRTGERYLLGGENLTIHRILDAFARVSGLPGPRLRVPMPVAAGAAGVVEGVSRLLRRKPMLTLANARASSFYFFVSSEKARRELGYDPVPVEPAIAEAARWFAENGYLKPSRARPVLAHVKA